jgi:hypothetical protein
MEIYYQISFAVLGAALWALVFKIMQVFRADRVASAFRLMQIERSRKLLLQANKAKDGNDTNPSLKASSISIFTNVAVTAALFLTIQFSIMISMGSADGFLSMCAYGALFNSLLSSAVCFIIALHSILAISMFEEDSVQKFLLHEYCSMGVKVSGQSLIGMAIVNADVSMFWIYLWGLLWICDNLNNKVGMALYWSFGSAFAVYCCEFAYGFFFSLVEKIKSDEDHQSVKEGEGGGGDAGIKFQNNQETKFPSMGGVGVA